MASKVLSTRPYLLRAFYSWIIDSNLTPHLVVNATSPDVKVPKEYIEDNRIVLNIAPDAIDRFVIGNEWVEFSASFSQVVERVTFPISEVVAIYAGENGKGMVFGEDDVEAENDGGGDDGAPPPTTSPTTGAPTEGKPTKYPHLRVVK